MTVMESAHVEYGATFGERNGRRVVEHYGRPERTHRAVRNGVGIFEPGYGILRIDGSDRVEYVDNVVSNRVPSSDGEGCYALLLDPQGRIESDLYVYNAGDTLLLFTPPGHAEPLAADWREKVFIQDVEIRDDTDEYAVFSVHGPHATEKIASVLAGTSPPENRFEFDRGSIGEAGVTIIRTDALAGEESYEIVCASEEAGDVFDSLLARGSNAVPVGYRTWETLTLEAGSPLFETELEGTIPNVLGLRTAVDFEKGCFVGQEVVSRVENLGQPSRILVGLSLEDELVPSPNAGVFDGDSTVGEVTRGAVSPLLETGIALALVEDEPTDPTVRVDGAEVPATVTSLPFVEGSERSARIPEYR